MSEIEHLEQRSHDELQYLDNVLEDVGTAKNTRAGLLKKAGFAAVGVGVLGQASAALASTSGDSAATITTNAVTAEALAVTVLTAAVKASPGTKSAQIIPGHEAANEAENDACDAVAELGDKAGTREFPGGTEVGSTAQRAAGECVLAGS